MPAQNQNSENSPLNSAQRAAAEAPTSPLLIVAGAGTGQNKDSHEPHHPSHRNGNIAHENMRHNIHQ